MTSSIVEGNTSSRGGDGDGVVILEQVKEHGNLLAETSMISTNADNSFILSRFLSRSSFIGPSKFNVFVQLLDKNEKYLFEYKKNATGQNVLDDVCKKANIAEKEYFGLQFEDNKFRYWVELSKSLSKQFHSKSISLRLRVRFYPTDSACVKEAITRYQLFVQIHRDLLHGRLICTQAEGAQLAALILQASIGDYNADVMGDDADYVSSYALIMKQSHKTEEKIAEAHKSLRGLSTNDAEKRFLEMASRLETYGFDPHVVKNVGQTQEVTVGATSHGVLLFVRGQKIHSIKWPDVVKVDYIGKQLTITPSREYAASFAQKKPASDDDAPADVHNTSLNSSLFDSAEVAGKTKSSNKEHLRLICPSATYAKHLWRHILAQQAFFTVDQAKNVRPKFSKPRIPLFSRGSTFRCPTPRVFNELEQDRSPPRSDTEAPVARCPLRRCQPRSVDESWNVSRSSSTHNSLERNAKLTPGWSTQLHSNEEPNTSTHSDASCPINEEFCEIDGALSSCLDKSENTASMNCLSGSNLTPTDESSDLVTANGSFTNILSKLSTSSLRKRISNGILSQNNHLASNAEIDGKTKKHEKLGSTAHSGLLLVGVLLLVFTTAFLVALFFFPDTLRGISLPPSLRVSMPSHLFELPSWLMSSALRR